MRNVSMLFLAVFFAVTARAHDGVESPAPETVSVPLTKAYIPVGFDDNDHVQVVVTGIFPDSCYKLGPVTAKVNAGAVEITQHAYRDNGLCLDLIVPFKQVVELDRMRAATYQIKDGTSGKVLGDLPVEVAKAPSADDFIYAPVEEAMILEERGGKGPTLYLTGNFPSKRMKIKEVRVQKYNEVVVVQPIVEVVKANEVEESPTPTRPRFEVKQVLKDLPKGNFLLHVRSMNGKAVNQLEDLGSH